MTFPRVITAGERLAAGREKITMCIFGKSGSGKTSLLHTLDPATTLAVDLEAGMLSVQSWPGDCIAIRSFEDARNLACYIGGANPSIGGAHAFSAAHYDYVREKLFPGWDLSKYSTIFFDSITDLSRLCMGWAKEQPEAFSEKTGKPDTRGAYGLMGREMIALLKHLQHAPGKNVVFVGILERREDDFNRVTWEPQMEGSKVGRELPGIVDQVVTLSLFDLDKDGQPQHAPDTGTQRAFVCRTINPFGLPAKDRSGNLDTIEPAHLGRLFDKILKPAQPAETRMTFGDFPAASASPLSSSN